MPKHFYFTILSHLMGGKPYILRLVVHRDDDGVTIDHYFEYGLLGSERLTLEDSVWSTDAEALLDLIPVNEQFHASMDIRLFLRTDMQDALDGSLMTDDFEIMVNHGAMTRSLEQIQAQASA